MERGRAPVRVTLGLLLAFVLLTAQQCTEQDLRKALERVSGALGESTAVEAPPFDLARAAAIEAAPVPTGTRFDTFLKTAYMIRMGLAISRQTLVESRDRLINLIKDARAANQISQEEEELFRDLGAGGAELPPEALERRREVIQRLKGQQREAAFGVARNLGSATLSVGWVQRYAVRLFTQGGVEATKLREELRSDPNRQSLVASAISRELTLLPATAQDAGAVYAEIQLLTALLQPVQ